MRRRETAEVESAGHESFLDVVTNIVCILIILVMIVGQHAKVLVVAEASAPPPVPQAAIEGSRRPRRSSKTCTSWRGKSPRSVRPPPPGISSGISFRRC